MNPPVLFGLVPDICIYIKDGSYISCLCGFIYIFLLASLIAYLNSILCFGPARVMWLPSWNWV